MRGFSILELMLALTIMASALAAVVLVTIGGPSALADGVDERIAVEKATNLLDQQMALAEQDFARIVSLASTTDGAYTTSLSASLLPDGLTKRLMSSVSWTDIKRRGQFLTLHTLVTDFQDATPSSCSNILAGDWSHPSALTYT